MLLRVPASFKEISEEQFLSETGFQTEAEKQFSALGIPKEVVPSLMKQLAEKPRAQWNEHDEALFPYLKLEFHTPLPAVWFKCHNVYALVAIDRTDMDYGWILLEKDANVDLPGEWACSQVDCSFPSINKAVESLARTLCAMS